MLKQCRKCHREFETDVSTHTMCPECAQKSRVQPTSRFGQGPPRPRPAGNPGHNPGHNPGQSQAYRRQSGPPFERGRDDDRVPLPSECVLSSFYGPDGFLKREVFIESAAEVARKFADAKMTTSSLRRLFAILLPAERRVKMAMDDPEAFSMAKETHARFLRQVTYLNNRKIQNKPIIHPEQMSHLHRVNLNNRKIQNKPIIPSVFHDFAYEHDAVAVRSAREFVGFVEYLRSIVCHMK